MLRLLLLGRILELQFQVCALLAGRLGEAEAAANSLVFTLLLIFFIFSIGFGDATGIRMATCLGDGNVAMDRSGRVSRLGRRLHWPHE